jgi:hypothetical protein
MQYSHQSYLTILSFLVSVIAVTGCVYYGILYHETIDSYKRLEEQTEYLVSYRNDVSRTFRLLNNELKMIKNKLQQETEPGVLSIEDTNSDSHGDQQLFTLDTFSSIDEV